MSETRFTLIGSRSEFHGAVHEALAEVADIGCREVFISDADFNDWPLSDAAVLASLTAWARSHRRLTLLASQFDELARRHGRWVEWRRQWSHLVECRANTEVEAARLPTMLLAPGVLVLRLVDPLRYRGSLSRETADLVHGREVIDAVLQRSAETFPVTTLGL
jgi:hypothetical protein